jgi:ribose transport system permease protein
MRRLNPLRVILQQRVLIVLLALALLGSFVSPEFMTTSNFQNILIQIATDGIIAVGMTFTIISGGFDLSVGSVLALAGVIAVGLQSSLGTLAGVVLALLMGLVIGLVNGVLVTRIGINPFITTLGTMTLVRGLALGITDTKPISGTDENFANLATLPVFGIPLAALIFLIALVAGYYVLTSTAVGRHIYAVGGNLEASWLSGVKTNAYRVGTYVLTSFLAAISGVLLASRINTGSPVVGRDTPLTVISAVLLGGTSMAGGSGSLIGTLEGVLVLGVLNNGLDLMGVADYYQTIFRGALLVLVVLFDRFYIMRLARRIV